MSAPNPKIAKSNDGQSLGPRSVTALHIEISPQLTNHLPNPLHGSLSSDEDEPIPLDFTIEDAIVLGSGGCGTVFLVSRFFDDMPMAVKTFGKFDDQGRLVGDSFTEESYASELIFYKNYGRQRGRSWMPAFYGHVLKPFNGQSTHWIAMEWFPDTLYRMSQTQKEYIRSKFYSLALSALNALEALHDMGWIHRDVKLDNLALRTDIEGCLEDFEVCLLDFGLVKEYSNVTCDDTECFCGTDDYASDRQHYEMVTGPADDLESLGYSLLELYLGHRWWQPEKHRAEFGVLMAENADPSKADDYLPNNENKRIREQEKISPATDRDATVTANPRPRQHQRTCTGTCPSSPPTLQACIALAPAAAAAAGMIHDKELKTNTMNADNKHGRSREDLGPVLVEKRNAAWAALQAQGKIPIWFSTWIDYCKDLTAFDCPDYGFLRDLLSLGQIQSTVTQKKDVCDADYKTKDAMTDVVEPAQAVKQEE